MSNITVHHLEQSQSFRIVWLLEELKVPYQLKNYQRMADLTAPEEYKQLSPLGTAPMVTISGEEGQEDKEEDIVLSESNAIIDYLLDILPLTQPGSSSSQDQLRPNSVASTTDRRLRREYLFWYHSIQGTFQPLIQVDSLFRILSKKIPWPVSYLFSAIASKVQANYILPRLRNYLRLVDEQLSKTTKTRDDGNGNDGEMFLVDRGGGDGRLTAADIACIYPMEAALLRYPELPTEYPNCDAWLKQMRQRPAFQSALTQIGEQHNGGMISNPLS